MINVDDRFALEDQVTIREATMNSMPSERETPGTRAGSAAPGTAPDSAAAIAASTPCVESFYDPATATFTHVVYDGEGGRAAIVDPVLDFDPASARTSTQSADRLLRRIDGLKLRVDWILETHAHADHLSAAGYLKEATGGSTAIGRSITGVQARFKQLFGLGPEFTADGGQFDRLLDEGDELPIGRLSCRVIATPGHTQDGLTYVVGDAAFIGDTLFAPDTGTARADFPGGDARTLYHSIDRLLGLPASTRLFLCHDYPPPGREPQAVFTVEEQRRCNVHVGGDTGEASFVERRRARDANLAAPRLLLPALQVNIRGGRLPAPDLSGVSYLRLPLNQVGIAS